MVRCTSFKDREHDQLVSSHQNGSVDSDVAGTRGFSSIGFIDKKLSIDYIQNDSRIIEGIDELGSFTHSASDTFTVDGGHGQVFQGMGRSGSAWITKAGRLTNELWTTEDSFERRQGVRASANLSQEDDGAFNNPNNLPSQMSSRNELSTVSPAGTSAFDFTEVFCLSPQSSPQCKSSPRPSWGDRDLPQSIANLRDAINARSRTAATDASGPRSPDTPNIVARLMGLDDLPGEEKSASKHINRGGASIKQEMLQDGLQSFPSPSLALAEKRAEQWNAGRTDSTELCIPSFPDRNASMQAEYHSMSKSIKMIQVDNKAKSATTTTTPRQSRAYGMNSLENLKIPRPAQSRKTGNLAAVNLKQSEQGLPSSSESQDGHHDEIEQRLMQLGLQSSEQERETLKQVLEAMELKGLLKSPHVIRSSEVIKPDHTPPCSSITTSEVDRHAIFNVNRSTGILPRDPLMAKPTMCRGPIMSHNKRKTKSAPIAAKRPFKPVGKSLGLPFSAANQRVSNERAKPRSFSGVKLVSSSQKLQTESKSKDVSVKELANANLTRARTSHVAPASSRVAEQAKTENRRTSSKTKDDLRHTVEGCTRANPFEGSEKSKANISSQRFQDKSVKPKGRMKHRLIIVDKNDNSIPAKTLNDNDAGAFTRGVQHRSEKYECTSGRCRSHLSPQKAIPGDALGAETPPRAINRVRGLRKGECDFDKDVEQFSPVSVLEKQLSDNEACDSPVSEEGCHRKEGEVNDRGPSHGDEERRISPIPMPQLNAIRATFDKAEMANIEKNSPSTSHLRHVIHGSLDVPIDCIYAAQRKEDFMLTTLQVPNDKKDDLEASREALNTELDPAMAHSESEGWRSGSRKCFLSRGSHSIQCDPCMSNISGSINIHRSEPVHERDLSKGETHLYANLGNGGAYDVWSGNEDFCYTQDVLRIYGFVDHAAGRCMEELWSECGGKIENRIYQKLEELWDTMDGEGECTEGLDMGGELYRKSHQAAMRRKLIFDCVGEILDRNFSWSGNLSSNRGYGRSSVAIAVWDDIQQLEHGLSRAEDSMYAMLEQDLLQDPDYRMLTDCRRRMPAQVATVTLELEDDILDLLILETLS